jgi:hypothetical protein
MRLWDERCSFSLLIFAAAVLAGRKVHRQLKLQWVAGIAGLAYGDSNAELAAGRSPESQRSGTKNVAS